ncbi:MAG: aspartate-semialdehyde dehydrogenase [Holosporaceae bacterium]|jgi:aspartate-semialdehyde dehydrogenase|nr:aspartate-semialdehyde dehydrogenase [Holosporaceae bacterium]
MKHEYSIAIIGATGNAGHKTLQILEERNFPVFSVHLVASAGSVGKEMSFRNHTLKVQHFSDIDFSGIRLVFFCGGNALAQQYICDVTKKGCVVVDKSSYFRLDPKVPLVIPEVNGDVLQKGAPLGIVSTPNCVATPLIMTLEALSHIASPKRAVVSTYQSVSGAGRRAIDELYIQTKSLLGGGGTVAAEIFPKRIAHNVIPVIGDILGNGITEEEEKISFEVCKVLKSDVKIAVTCVRVPVFIGHCMSVACEFKGPVSENDAFEVLENLDGIICLDRRDNGGVFATPIDVQNEDAVYVSRIRRDHSVKNGLIYWIASDNLRKGAALNSVQIAEEMIRRDPSLALFQRRNRLLSKHALFR